MQQTRSRQTNDNLRALFLVIAEALGGIRSWVKVVMQLFAILI